MAKVGCTILGPLPRISDLRRASRHSSQPGLHQIGDGSEKNRKTVSFSVGDFFIASERSWCADRLLFVAITVASES
jgi:hypothetical protein